MKENAMDTIVGTTGDNKDKAAEYMMDNISDNIVHDMVLISCFIVLEAMCIFRQSFC